MTLVCCGSTRPLVLDTWGYVCPDCRRFRMPDGNDVPAISPEWAADLLRASQSVYHTPYDSATEAVRSTPSSSVAPSTDRPSGELHAETTNALDHRSEGFGAVVNAARPDCPGGTYPKEQP